MRCCHGNHPPFWILIRSPFWILIGSPFWILIGSPFWILIGSPFWILIGSPFWILIGSPFWILIRPPFWISIRPPFWILVRSPFWILIRAPFWILIKPPFWILMSRHFKYWLGRQFGDPRRSWLGFPSRAPPRSCPLGLPRGVSPTGMPSGPAPRGLPTGLPSGPPLGGCPPGLPRGTVVWPGVLREPPPAGVPTGLLCEPDRAGLLHSRVPLERGPSKALLKGSSTVRVTLWRLPGFRFYPSNDSCRMHWVPRGTLNSRVALERAFTVEALLEGIGGSGFFRRTTRCKLQPSRSPGSWSTIRMRTLEGLIHSFIPSHVGRSMTSTLLRPNAHAQRILSTDWASRIQFGASLKLNKWNLEAVKTRVNWRIHSHKFTPVTSLACYINQQNVSLKYFIEWRAYLCSSRREKVPIYPAAKEQ